MTQHGKYRPKSVYLKRGEVRLTEIKGDSVGYVLVFAKGVES